eukprot:5445761-Amphidinium_carterae.2
MALTNPVPARQLKSAMARMGMMPRRVRCPRCGGKLKKDRFHAEINSYHYRRRHFQCHARVHWLHGHPVLVIGGLALSVNLQMRILMSILQGVPLHSIHHTTGVSHASIERLASRVRSHIAGHMVKMQDKMVVGGGATIEDSEVEVDECTMCKYPSSDRKKPALA